MSYPNARVRYSTTPDAAWLGNTKTLKWLPREDRDPRDVVGHIGGGCPRCGHAIGTTVRGIIIAGVTEIPVSARIPKGGVGMICQCGDTHKPPAGKTGCGAGFDLSVEDIKALSGFPQD